MSKRKTSGTRKGGTLKFEDKEYYAGMEDPVPRDRWLNFISAGLAKEGPERSYAATCQRSRTSQSRRHGGCKIDNYVCMFFEIV